VLSDRLAGGLGAAGIRPGDPVALQLPSIPQFGILKAEGTAYCRKRMAACDYLRVIDFPDEPHGTGSPLQVR
jgi:hypothetical protein